MKCLTDMEFELLVLGGKSVADREGEIQSHIAHCDHCSQRLREFRQFYAYASEFMARDPQKAEKELLRDLRKGSATSVLVAYPFQPRFQPSRERLSIMAAANTTLHAVPIVETVGVLATRDGDLLVRIMRSSETGHITGYLISDDVRKYRNVLVRIPPVQGEYVSDREGIVHLGKVPVPDPEELVVEIQPPQAVFDLPLEQLISEDGTTASEMILTDGNRGSTHVSTEYTPEEVILKVRPQGVKPGAVTESGDISRVLVAPEEGEVELERTEKGVAVFGGLKKSDTVRIQIFD